MDADHDTISEFAFPPTALAHLARQPVSGSGVNFAIIAQT